MKLFHGHVVKNARSWKVIVMEYEHSTAKMQPETITKDPNALIWRGFVHAMDASKAKQKLVEIAKVKFSLMEEEGMAAAS